VYSISSHPRNRVYGNVVFVWCDYCPGRAVKVTLYIGIRKHLLNAVVLVKQVLRLELGGCLLANPLSDTWRNEMHGEIFSDFCLIDSLNSSIKSP